MLRKLLLVGLFVNLEPGSILQIAIGTIVCAVHLLVQLVACPYKNPMDGYLAQGSSFSLMMVFTCCLIYKFDALTASEACGRRVVEQREK